MHYCMKCKRTLDGINFYSSKNSEKFPDGKFNLCKKCLTMHVNNWDPKTFLGILEDADVPYIETEWAKIIESSCKDPKKVTGTTVLGRYLSKMKLTQWRDYTWADSDRLREHDKVVKEAALIRQGLSEEQIKSVLEEKILQEEPEEIRLAREAPAEEEKEEPYLYELPPDDASLHPENELTDDDKRMLCLKWGRTYKPYEWIQLEQLYHSITEDFDINNATHVDYLKLICKTSLKCNQLMDHGDLDGYGKLAKIYDTLMKSAKFTAAQNKQDGGDYVDSVGELIALAEEQAPIERFYIDSPNDKVDETIKDMKSYTYKLITDEQGLGNLIEGAISEMKRQEEKDELEEQNEDETDLNTVLEDLDFEEFADFLETDKGD